MDEPIRGALQEVRLTVIDGAVYAPWAVGFEMQYPGMTVQV